MLFDFLSAAFVHPAECIVEVAGSGLESLYPFITSISVEATRTGTEARISFASPANEHDHWAVADDPRLRPDAAITIKADFTTAREEVMRGIITTVSPSFPGNAGAATVEIHARDDGARLDRAPNITARGTPLAPTTDALILQTMLAGTGLSADPQSGQGQAGLALNQRTTDLTFLRNRATANGYDLLFEEGQVYFGPMRTGGRPQSAIMVYAGQATNCRSFNPSNRSQAASRQAYERRDAHGDPAGQAEVEADEPLLGSMPTRAAAALAPHTGRLDRRSAPREAENEVRAARAALDAQFAIRAEGELDGALYGHVLRVGKMVAVDGAGDLNSGDFFVDSVTHHFDVHGYSQKFVLLRNALGRRPGGGIVSALAGVLGG